MAAVTPHPSAVHRHGVSGRHDAHAEHTAPAMHPERAAVAGHLRHLHNMVTAPGMAEHPLTPSEHRALHEGGIALTRGHPSSTY